MAEEKIFANLNDDSLEKVQGGAWEPGTEVEMTSDACPRCGSSMAHWNSDGRTFDVFRCDACGGMFKYIWADAKWYVY